MSIPQITPEEAKKRLEAKSADFLDIRDPNSYAAGHIPGAKQLTDETIAVFLKTADKKRPLVINCYRGNASQGATAYLLEQGFQEVYSLMGGFEGWRSTGLIES